MSFFSAVGLDGLNYKNNNLYFITIKIFFANYYLKIFSWTNIEG
jgi:hypothetical protein